MLLDQQIQTAAAGGVVYVTGAAMEDVTQDVWDLYGEPTAESIARSLARQCRFNGHCRAFYSVAQHCCLVSDQFTDPVLALWGLMHDAAEAWLGDVVRPLKRMLWVGPPMRTLEAVEARIVERIAQRFGLPGAVVPESVLAMDDRALVTEARDLEPQYSGRLPWVAPFNEKIDPWPYMLAESRFLRRFADLDDARRAGRML